MTAAAKTPYDGSERRVRKPYTGPERREEPHLTEDQLEKIAEMAADRAVAKVTNGVYKAVGKTVIERFVWIVGALTVGAYFGLRKLGVI